MRSGQITIEALFSIMIVLLATGFALESQNTFFNAAEQHASQKEIIVEFEKTAIMLDAISTCGKGCFLKIKNSAKEDNLDWSVCEKNRVCDKTGKPIKFTVATSATNQKNIETYCPYEAEVFC
ncbi:MAG: hypothetical protein KAS30_04735 [Candidatus Diapherotrites archaeon]|nr:hypothetical protein [Candidatus Diapherotrites archaeon]